MPDTTEISQILARMGADVRDFADQASADFLAGASSLSPQQRAEGIGYIGQLRTLQGDIAAAGMASLLAGRESDVRELQGGTAQLKTVLQQVQAAETQLQFVAIWVPAVGSVIASLRKADLGGAFTAFQDASKAWGKVVHPDGAQSAPAPARLLAANSPGPVTITITVTGAGSAPAPAVPVPVPAAAPAILPTIRFVPRAAALSSGSRPFPHACVDVDLAKHGVHPHDRMISAIRENPKNDPTRDGSPEAEIVRTAVANGAGTVHPAHVGVMNFMAIWTGKMWQTGRTLLVGFLNGTSTQRQRVMEHAREWETYANIRFQDSGSQQGDIRIAFGPDPGSWSAIGTDAMGTQNTAPTMNFGWLYDDTDDTEYNRTVVHEFGHALGCIHEHQNPAGGINWNKTAVYAYYEGPPNNWSPADVDENIFRKYDKDQTNFTQVDPASIMMYPIPAAFTTDGFSAGWNTDLSPTDKAFIRQNYQ